MAANLKFLLTANDKATPVVRKLSNTIKLLGGVAGITTGVILGRKLFGAFKSMIQIGIEFEAEMARVTSVLGDVAIRGTKGFTALRQAAIDLGASTVYTARQVAEAQLIFARAGFEVNEILTALNPTLSLAAAGNLSIADAADIAATALRSFGKEGEKAEDAAKRLSDGIDIIVKTATTSNQTVREFGEALAYAAPAAKVAGADILELGVAFGILANRGLKSTIAGTGVRKAFAVILKSAGALEGGISSVNKEMQSTIETGTGLSRAVADKMFEVADDGERKFVGWAKAVEVMKAAGYSAGDMFTVFGVRAGNAMAILTDLGGPAIVEYQQKLKDFEGVAEEVRERAIDSLGGDLIILKSAWESLSIAITDQGTPALRAYTTALTELITQVRESDEAMKGFDVILNSIVSSVVWVTAAMLAWVGAAGYAVSRVVASFLWLRGTLNKLNVWADKFSLRFVEAIGWIVKGWAKFQAAIGNKLAANRTLANFNEVLQGARDELDATTKAQQDLIDRGKAWRRWGSDVSESFTEAAGKVLGFKEIAETLFNQSISNRPKTPESEKAAELEKLKKEVSDLGIELKFLGQEYQDWEELLLSNGVYVAGESLGRLALKIENVIKVATKAGPKMKTLGFALLKKQIDSMVAGYKRAGIEVPKLFLKWQAMARDAEIKLILDTEDAATAIERTNAALSEIGIGEIEGAEGLQKGLDDLADRYDLLKQQLSAKIITQVTFDDTTDEMKRKFLDFVYELGDAAVISPKFDFADSIVKANTKLKKLGVSTVQSLSTLQKTFDGLLDSYVELQQELIKGNISPIEFVSKEQDLLEKLQESIDKAGGKIKVGIDYAASGANVDMSDARAELITAMKVFDSFETGLDLDIGDFRGAEHMIGDLTKLDNAWSILVDKMVAKGVPEATIQLKTEEFFKALGEIYDAMDADGQAMFLELLPYFDPSKWSEKTKEVNDLLLSAEQAQLEQKKNLVLIGLEKLGEFEFGKRAAAISELHLLEQDAIDQNYQAQLVAAGEDKDKKAAINAEYAAATKQADDNTTAALEANDKLAAKTKKEQAVGAAKAITGALQATFGDSKAAAIASALMNTYEAYTKAIAELGPAGPAVGAVLVGLGLAQVAKIKKQKGPGAAYGTTVTGIDTGRDTEPYFLRVGETVLTKNDSAALNRMLAGGASSFDSTRLGQAMDLNRQPVIRSGGPGFAFGGAVGAPRGSTTRRRTLEALAGTTSSQSPDTPGLADLNADERETRGDVHLHIDRVLDGADLRSVLEANLDEFGEMIREAGRRGTI